MIIDISTGRQRSDGQTALPPKPEDAEAKGVTVEQRVMQYRETWKACRHWHMEFNERQRTIACSDCGMWLDPFWAFLELYRYYDERVDDRLAAIAAWEQRQKEQRERQEKRRAAPRRALIDRRAETAERAAYNEYQAKLLALRAERQRALVAKLDAQIEESGGPR